MTATARPDTRLGPTLADPIRLQHVLDDRERTEKSVLDACRRELKRRGAWYMKTQSGGRSGGRRGLPDLIACHRGRFLGIETKRPHGGRVSPLQRLELEAITGAGGVSMVVSYVDELITMLDLIDVADGLSRPSEAPYEPPDGNDGEKRGKPRADDSEA